MTPQLERLVGLWNASLEGTASASDSAELKSLLQDASLCEEFAAWQAEQASSEPETALGDAQWAALGAKLRTRFKTRVLVRRFRPALIALAALAGGGLLYAFWPSTVQQGAVKVDETPFKRQPGSHTSSPSEAEALAPVSRELSAPPVLSASALSVQASGAGIQARILRPLSGPLALSVLRPDGSLVRQLLRGASAAKGQTLSWDGKDSSGRPAPLGKYLLHLESPSLTQDRAFHLEKR